MLFGIGLIGLMMITRNLIKIVILLQLMAKAAILGMALAGSILASPDLVKASPLRCRGYSCRRHCACSGCAGAGSRGALDLKDAVHPAGDNGLCLLY